MLYSNENNFIKFSIRIILIQTNGSFKTLCKCVYVYIFPFAPLRCCYTLYLYIGCCIIMS